MKNVTADIKTSPTERVRQDRMPRTRVLELRPLYPILFASLATTKMTRVYPRKLKYVASGPVHGTAATLFNIPLHYRI